MTQNAAREPWQSAPLSATNPEPDLITPPPSSEKDIIAALQEASVSNSRGYQENAIPYVEAQVHGGISLKDISRIEFSSVIPPTSPLMEKLSKLGIPYTMPVQRSATLTYTEQLVAFAKGDLPDHPISPQPVAKTTKSISKAAGEIWAKFALFTIRKGDKPGHGFHGNQYVAGIGSGEIHRMPMWAGTTEDYNYLINLTKSKNLPHFKTEIPKGWKQVPSGDPKKILYQSENGNTAIFAKGSRGWQAGERLSNSALASLDKLSTGKTLDFTQAATMDANTNAWVNPAVDPNVICMGKWSSVAAVSYWQSAELPGMKEAPESLATSYEATLKRPFPTGEQKEITPEMMGKTFTYGDLIANAEGTVEATIAHELGHSNFYADGHKISEIYSALAFSEHEMGANAHNWEKVMENATNQYVVSAKFGAWDTPDGRIQRADYAKWSLESGSGSVTFPKVIQKQLVAIGASRYGATSLQELVAETHSAFQNPLFPATPLVTNIANAMGWKKVAKSVTKSVEPNSIAPEGFLADGFLGPMWVEGNRYRDLNGDWHEMNTAEPEDLMWFFEGRIAQGQK
jgi:hypothetical protein